MKILIVKVSAFLPGAVSGANRSVDTLIRTLSASGHDVVLLCSADTIGELSGAGLLKEPLPYPVLRVTDPVADLGAVLKRFAPDVVVHYGSGGGPTVCATCAAVRIRVIHYSTATNFESERLMHGPQRGLVFAANSEFSARKFALWYGLDAVVIPPMIDPAPFMPLRASSGDAVLFINPAPHKGVYLAMRIARALPHRRFIFGEAWAMPSTYLAALKQQCPGNVEWKAPTLTPADLYREARVVLTPSIWEEAWGRVVSEGHAAGVPAIASRRGGLPEAVGFGGVTIELTALIDNWVEAIETMFDDGVHYNECSAAACAYADRPEFGLSALAESWLVLMRPPEPPATPLKPWARGWASPILR